MSANKKLLEKKEEEAMTRLALRMDTPPDAGLVRTGYSQHYSRYIDGTIAAAVPREDMSIADGVEDLIAKGLRAEIITNPSGPGYHNITIRVFLNQKLISTSTTMLKI